MPIFIDPTGQPTYGIGICARCSRKLPLAELHPDPNSPGLLVCLEDRDDYDPYRLPPRQTEDITLPFVRPDVSLSGEESAGIDTEFILETEDDIFFTTEDGDFLVVEDAP